MVKEYNPNCLEIGSQGSSFLSKSAVLIIVLQNEDELWPKFADLKTALGPHSASRRVGPSTHESSQKQFFLVYTERDFKQRDYK